jgi:nicotinic acid mononucleotide adenylyltransferase
MRYIREDQQKDFAFSDGERMEMLSRIAAANEWMEVSNYEILSAEQPRTYCTLCHLREMGIECSSLFGSDKLIELETVWKHVGDIAKEFGIYCMERYEDNCTEIIENDPYLKALAPYITVLETPDTYHHMSSTKVRQLYKQARSILDEISDMVPEELDGLRRFLFEKE